MEQKFQPSFIPKKQVEAERLVARASRPMTIFSWLAYLLFIAAVFSTVGLFGYDRYLLAQNKKQRAALDKEIALFDQTLTKNLSEIKTRLNAGQGLLSRHLAFSLFFSLLNSITVQTVQFNDFNFTTDGSGLKINVKGLAPSYAVLAFQARVIKANPALRETIFSDPVLDEKGGVTFQFSSLIDPSAVLYRKSFELPEAPPLLPVDQ